MPIHRVMTLSLNTRVFRDTPAITRAKERIRRVVAAGAYTEHHMNAISRWHQFSFTYINSYLRNLAHCLSSQEGRAYDPLRAQREHLAMCEIPTICLDHNITLWRGLSLANIPTDTWCDPGWMGTSLRRYIAIDAANKRHSQWTDEYRQQAHSRCVFRIKLRAGTPVIPLWALMDRDNALAANELEMLILPGTKFHVEKASKLAKYTLITLAN